MEALVDLSPPLQGSSRFLCSVQLRKHNYEHHG